MKTTESTPTNAAEGRSSAEVEFDSIGRAFDASKFRTENGRPKRDARGWFVPQALGSRPGSMPDGLRFVVVESVCGEAEVTRAAFVDLGDARAWAKSRRMALGAAATVRIYRGRAYVADLLEEFPAAAPKPAPQSSGRAD